MDNKNDHPWSCLHSARAYHRLIIVSNDNTTDILGRVQPKAGRTSMLNPVHLMELCHQHIAIERSCTLSSIISRLCSTLRNDSESKAMSLSQNTTPQPAQPRTCVTHSKSASRPPNPTSSDARLSAQSILNRRRRQFINTLPSKHPLRKYSQTGTGNLVREHLHAPTPPPPPASPRPRHRALNPTQNRRLKKIKTSNDPQSAASVLGRNTFRQMWNGIGERATREHEWREFDRVKPKLLRLKKRYGFSEVDLEDEECLEGKRARSRRRAARERERSKKVMKG